MSLILRTDVKLATVWGLLALLSLLLLPLPCHCPGPSIHPYTDVFPLNYHMICCWQELPNHKGIFFLIALQTKIKNQLQGKPRAS